MPDSMLDTNIISYVLKRPLSPIGERFRRTPSASIRISSIVETELRYGAARLPKEARLHALVEEVLQSLTIVAWDSSCAKACALLRAKLQPMGVSISYADAMIAAHAIALNRVLVTNDLAFQRIPGLHIEHWPIAPGDSYK